MTDNSTSTAILVCVGVVAVAGIVGAVMAPTQTAQIIGFCTLIGVALMNMLQANRAAVKVDEAAVKVAEVKSTLIEQTAQTAQRLDTLQVVAESAQQVGAATHTLVNSGWGVQLKINMLSTRRVAEYSKDPVDAEAAKLAEQLYKEHQAKQAIVDSSKLALEDKDKK